MKKTLFTVACIMFGFLCASAQGDLPPYGLEKDEIVKFKVKSITIATQFESESKGSSYKYFFNDGGDVIKTVDLEGRLLSEFVYNGNGLLLEKRGYRKTGEPYPFLKNEYDGKNKLMKTIELDENGNVFATIKYEYDPQGSKTRETRLKGAKTENITTFKYSGSKLAEERLSNPSFTEKIINYRYNSNGILIEKRTKTLRPGHATFTEILTYGYGASGKLIKATVTGSAGLTEERFYEYGSSGLLEKEIQKGLGASTTTYTVEF